MHIFTVNKSSEFSQHCQNCYIQLIKEVQSSCITNFLLYMTIVLVLPSLTRCNNFDIPTASLYSGKTIAIHTFNFNTVDSCAHRVHIFWNIQTWLMILTLDGKLKKIIAINLVYKASSKRTQNKNPKDENKGLLIKNERTKWMNEWMGRIK